MSSRTPSKIARTLAGQLWPDVQSQRKLGPGVYDFSCAGHGGTIAVLEHSEMTPAAIEVARKYQKTELVVYDGPAPGRCYTTERYTREGLEEYAATHSAVERFECWVGEEDCDWALLVVANPKLAEGMAEAYPSKSGAQMLQYARECSGRWNAEALAELDAIGTPAAPTFGDPLELVPVTP